MKGGMCREVNTDELLKRLATESEVRFNTYRHPVFNSKIITLHINLLALYQGFSRPRPFRPRLHMSENCLLGYKNKDCV